MSLTNILKRIEEKNIQETKDDLNIVIIPAGKFSNSRFDYAEGGLTGDEETINSMRFGIQYGSYPVMINALPNKSVYLISGKKEIVTSADSPDGRNRIVLENAGEKIEYDAVIRFIEEHPAEHMYFLKENYIFTRKFTPSMGGGQPKDMVENPTMGDRIWNQSKCIHKLEIAKPLIIEMEKEIGRKMVNDKYYSYLTDKEVFYKSQGDVRNHIQSNLCW